MYQKVVKRVFDFLISGVCIVLFSPIFLILAILVRIKLGSPVLFVQERPGYKNRIFNMYKFRTMTDEKDENGELLPDEVRLTKFGRMLRSTSLDELPELFNIFKGDMSIIGPRPLLPKYLNVYSARQQRRHEVLPGLTGLAQISGRNAISWEEKFEFDLEYVNDISFLLDIKILFMTVIKVFKRSDINADDAATMAMFNGTKKQRFGSQNSKNINVLFVGAGKKVELIQTFLYAAGNLGINMNTFGADSSLSEPAMLACKYQRRTMLPTNEGYSEQILNICTKDKIDIVIPMGEEQAVLAKNKSEFENQGIVLLLSSNEIVDICMDKNQVINFFSACGVHTPKVFSDIKDFDDVYPVAVEIKEKTKGIFSYKASNRKELEYYCSMFENYLIRPYIEGDAYEIDVMCDFNGRIIYITPRIKEAATAGAIATYRVVQDEMMILETAKIVSNIKPIGPLTLGVIKDNATGFNYFVSMWPFFSNNVAVSIKAGADSPCALLNLMYGIPQEYKPNAAEEVVVFGKFEQSVVITDKTSKVESFKDFSYLNELGDDIEAVIFALDDTLYSEKSYLRSGFRALARHLPNINHCFNRLCVALEKGHMPIEEVLKEEGIYSEELLEECLQVVREHEPSIKLYEGVEDILKELHRKKKMIGIITDGEPTKQRNKIKALGLDLLVDEIIVTDELAGNGNVKVFRKPNDLAYLIMRRRLDIPLRNMAFVGDNIETDFVAPKKLGMKCYLYENEDRLYE